MSCAHVRNNDYSRCRIYALNRGKACHNRTLIAQRLLASGALEYMISTG